MQIKYDSTQTSNKINELVGTIKQFINEPQSAQFDLYPTSNELGWQDIIKNLKQMSICDSENINVSLLFGESNFLSLSPWISSSIVLLADINPELHKCTAFLIDCFKKSETPEAFFHCYINEHPCLNLINFETKKYFTQQDLEKLMRYSMKELGKYHFLANQKSFERCKNSFEKITFVQIYLNLADNDRFDHLNNILTKFDAKLVLTNITNIHHYIDHDLIKTSVSNLLKNNQNPLIIYSAKIGDYLELRALCVKNLEGDFIRESWHDRYGQFLQIVASYPHVIDNFIANNSNFFRTKKEMKPEYHKDFCYLGYAGSKESIKNFIENKQELRPYYFNLCVYDTEQEAKDFIIKEFEKYNTPAKKLFFPSPKLSDGYWIITFRGSKEKINQWLRCRDDQENLVSIHDQYANRLQLFSRVINAVNQDKSMVISKEEVAVLNNGKGYT